MKTMTKKQFVDRASQIVNECIETEIDCAFEEDQGNNVLQGRIQMRSKLVIGFEIILRDAFRKEFSGVVVTP